MYLALLAFVYVCGVIVYCIFTDVALVWEIPVKLRSVTGLPHMESTSSLFSLASVNNVKGVLNIHVRMTALNSVLIFLCFFGYAFFAFHLLRILRQLFSSLLKQNPFDMVNIRRLRLVAGCVAGLVAVHFFTGIFNDFILRNYFNEKIYVAKIEPNWNSLILAMTIYVLSAIFRRGYELKTENESIV
jgi:hypothetical protein